MFINGHGGDFMGKLQQITIDGIISSRTFYETFYKHIESTAFAAKNKGGFESFWFGETHHSGEFEVGYHSFDFQRHYGTESESFKRRLQPHIHGKLTYKDGKTIISYEQENKISLFGIVLMAFVLFALIPTVKAFIETKNPLCLLIFPFFIIAIIDLCGCFKANTKFPKKLNAIIEDCKKSSDV